MTDFTIYNETTGVIRQTGSTPNVLTLEYDLEPGETWLEGKSDPERQKVSNGIITDFTKDELNSFRGPIKPYQITQERGKKLIEGEVFNIPGYGNVALQGRQEDQITLLGLKDAALLRLQSGDTTTLQKFRDRDNVDHLLAPQQIIDLWMMGAEWMSVIYQASWDLKAMDPIPENFSDPVYWTSQE